MSGSEYLLWSYGQCEKMRFLSTGYPTTMDHGGDVCGIVGVGVFHSHRNPSIGQAVKLLALGKVPNWLCFVH